MRTVAGIYGKRGTCRGEANPNEVFTHRGQIVRALPYMLIDSIDECAGCIGQGAGTLCWELPTCHGMTFVLHVDQEGDRADLIQEDNEGDRADLIQEDNEIGNFDASAFRKWFIVERCDTGARQAGRHVAAAWGMHDNA